MEEEATIVSVLEADSEAPAMDEATFSGSRVAVVVADEAVADGELLLRSVEDDETEEVALCIGAATSTSSGIGELVGEASEAEVVDASAPTMLVLVTIVVDVSVAISVLVTVITNMLEEEFVGYLYSDDT